MQKQNKKEKEKSFNINRLSDVDKNIYIKKNIRNFLSKYFGENIYKERINRYIITFNIKMSSFIETRIKMILRRL